jgi:hypothetical protein
MVNTEELACGLMMFGRGNILGIVARSNDVHDALTYLRVEQGIELARVTPFVTTNSLTFERKKAFACAPNQPSDESKEPLSSNSYDSEGHQEKEDLLQSVDL